jgi:nucleoside-diphosphate-sugar epimerase
MKVCITGANGFIGKKLTEKALTTFDQVIILTRKDTNTFNNVTVVKGDLTDLNCPLESFVSDCDIVFHCAGEIKNPALMKALHENGTKKLVEAIENESVKKNKKIHLVHLSSVGVYGPPAPAHSERTITEESPYNPVGDYEVTKCNSDMIVMEAAKKQNFTFSILRPSNVFGANMPTNSLRQLGKLVHKKLFFYVGKPKSIATYVHVEDVVTALLLCAQNPNAKGNIYNLSNDCAFEEMIEGMAKALKVSPPKVRIPELPIRIFAKIINSIKPTPLTDERINALVIRTKYPISKLQNELGFKPKLSVPETIADVFLN